MSRVAIYCFWKATDDPFVPISTPKTWLTLQYRNSNFTQPSNFCTVSRMPKQFLFLNMANLPVLLPTRGEARSCSNRGGGRLTRGVGDRDRDLAAGSLVNSYFLSLFPCLCLSLFHCPPCLYFFVSSIFSCSSFLSCHGNQSSPLA